jgi:hypothetical protein
MKKLSIFLFIAVLLGLVVSSAVAQTQPFKIKDKLYYKVSGDDPAVDTGNEVCIKNGLTCVGYTATGNDACKYFHPDATSTTSVNGSKSGFYCNGAPQKGLACENAKNNCQNCPNCNVNADCTTEIGTQFKEMYVECYDPEGKITAAPGRLAKFYGWASNWWGSLRSTVAKSFDHYRQKLMVLLQTKVVKKAKIQVTGPNGTVETDIPVDSYVCEFYQNKKKLATCGALAAADHFCVTAMNSQHAKAEYCEENGLIVCSNPCTTNPQQIKPKTCAFDNDRPRGKQAPILDFCNETKTIKVDMGDLAKKKAGQECAHGGECTTGYCLGQPSDSGIKYFCSCKQNVLDYTCGK